MLVDLETTVPMTECLDALAAVDPSVLSDGAVHRSLLDLHEILARLTAVAARFGAEWDRRQLWTSDNSQSASARLARDLNCARATAKRATRLAAALSKMPIAADAFEQGHINVDHVELLRHAAGRKRGAAFAEDERQLVEWCAELDYPDAVTALSYWTDRVDATLGDDGDPPELRDREASWGRGVGRERRLEATLDPVGGGIVCSELDRLERELWNHDQRDPDSTRSDAQRRADALIEMAKRSCGSPGEVRAPRIALTVAVGDDSFKHLCELSNGDVVTPGHLRPYLDMYDVNTIVFDGPFHAIAASPSRNFRGALRRAIEIRDRRCQHPAGDHDPIDRCDVDHVVPHSEGGITCQCNGRLLGRYRNRNPRARPCTLGDVHFTRDHPQHLAIRARFDALIRDVAARRPEPDF
jgi:hypothetical protein